MLKEKGVKQKMKELEVVIMMENTVSLRLQQVQDSGQDLEIQELLEFLVHLEAKIDIAKFVQLEV